MDIVKYSKYESPKLPHCTSVIKLPLASLKNLTEFVIFLQSGSSSRKEKVSPPELTPTKPPRLASLLVQSGNQPFTHGLHQPGPILTKAVIALSVSDQFKVSKSRY